MITPIHENPPTDAPAYQPPSRVPPTDSSAPRGLTTGDAPRAYEMAPVPPHKETLLTKLTHRLGLDTAPGRKKWLYGAAAVGAACAVSLAVAKVRRAATR